MGFVAFLLNHMCFHKVDFVLSKAGTTKRIEVLCHLPCMQLSPVQFPVLLMVPWAQPGITSDNRAKKIQSIDKDQN